jgi:hypothetical protein
MVRLVCDGAGLLSPLVDLTLLKFRERDALEFTFKTWAPSVPFDGAWGRHEAPDVEGGGY